MTSPFLLSHKKYYDTLHKSEALEKGYILVYHDIHQPIDIPVSVRPATFMRSPPLSNPKYRKHQ